MIGATIAMEISPDADAAQCLDLLAPSCGCEHSIRLLCLITRFTHNTRRSMSRMAFGSKFSPFRPMFAQLFSCTRRMCIGFIRTWRTREAESGANDCTDFEWNPNFCAKMKVEPINSRHFTPNNDTKCQVPSLSFALREMRADTIDLVR